MYKFFLPLAVLILVAGAALRMLALGEYPPGPHYDEAANLLIGRSIAFGGARFFPMVEAYQGREVLYYYLAAPLLIWVNDSTFSLQLVNAFSGLIAIAATMALGRAMFPGRRGIVIGLAAGTLIALSYPQVWLSRQAFRAITLPMMQGLALLFLWRGLHAASSGNRWLLVGGLFAGGALYTYNASRLLPLWLLLAGMLLLLVDRAHWRMRLRQGIIFFGALALAAAPMAVYALVRPEIFFGRLAEVTAPEDSVSLAQSLLLHLRMFFIEGDPYLRYNIPGRPYLTWPEGLLLLIGIVVAARRMFSGAQSALVRTAYGLALLSPLMVIPSLISVGGLPPSHMRSIAMVPLLFILVAVGFEFIFSRLAGRIAPVQQRSLLTALLTMALVFGTVSVSRIYFEWARRIDVYEQTDADLNAAAVWLSEQQIDPSMTQVYVAARDRGHPTVMIHSLPPVTWLGTDSLVWPPPGQTGLYIFPRSAPPPSRWRDWLAPGALAELPNGPDGQPAFEAYWLPAGVPLPLSDDISFGGLIRNAYLTFVGAETEAFISGQVGVVTTGWRVDTPPEVDDFTLIVELRDQHGDRLARAEPYLNETDRWVTGSTLFQRTALDVPIALHPGRYVLYAAWVARATETYAPYWHPDDGFAGIWAQVGEVEIALPQEAIDPALIAMDVRADQRIAPGLRLRGWDRLRGPLRPGERLPIVWYWQAESRPNNADVAVVLSASDGGQIEIGRGVPLADRLRPSDWPLGAVLVERPMWRVPLDLPGGSYSVIARGSLGEVTLDELEIAGMARLFDPPRVDRAVGARFGGMIELYGYSLARDGGRLQLRLVWRAAAEIKEAFTVFVHLVDESSALLDQRDSMPQGGMYPTNLWFPGEYVEDHYELSAPPQAVALRVGWYRAEDGRRLPVDSPTSDGGRDDVVIALDE
ncbi:MAG: hypothetical protein SNJ59_03140 [Aggregatilineales bacterium]